MMWALAACDCTKAVYLASSHSSSLSSSVLSVANSGNSVGTVGALLGEAGLAWPLPVQSKSNLDSNLQESSSMTDVRHSVFAAYSRLQKLFQSCFVQL